MKVLISKGAHKNFLSIKKFIAFKWGSTSAMSFEMKVIDFIKCLAIFPEIGITEVAEKKLYSFKLTKQTRVFHRVKNEQTIIIISFFDLRQNPSKKPS